MQDFHAFVITLIALHKITRNAASFQSPWERDKGRERAREGERHRQEERESGSERVRQREREREREHPITL